MTIWETKPIRDVTGNTVGMLELADGRLNRLYVYGKDKLTGADVIVAVMHPSAVKDLIVQLFSELV